MNSWRIKRVSKKRKLPVMSITDKCERFHAFLMKPRLYADNRKYFCMNWKTGECWYE